MGSTEESEKKRRNPNNHSGSPPLKKQHLMGPSSDDKKIDAAMLQYQNHKLAQQLDVQRAEIHALETSFSDLKTKQASYDDTLMAVNRAWNLLVDDLELLALRSNTPVNGLRVLDSPTADQDRLNPSVPVEETFLHRLLDCGATESSNSVETSLAIKRASTLKTMRFLVQAIDLQRSRNEGLSLRLRDHVSSDEAGQMLKTTYDELRAETVMLRSAMDALHLHHREVSLEIAALRDSSTRDQLKINQLSGELEETVAELELGRRKLAALRNQKNTSAVALPGLKTEAGERGVLEKGLGDMVDTDGGLVETKALAAQRLVELEESHQAKLSLIQQLHQIEAILCDEQHIVSSRPYNVLNEQVQHLKTDLERYQTVVEKLQAEHDNAVRREKEATLKFEAAESARNVNVITELRVAELEDKLHHCVLDRDMLRTRLEEAVRASGRKETVSELKVMVTTLHKEISMLQSQLNKYKEASRDVHSFKAEVHLLTSILETKEKDHKGVVEMSAKQVELVKMLRDELRAARQSEQEMQLILNMCERESTETRDVMDLRQAECRAWAEVERFKTALDEHSLELQVKAANEAEAACQKRLAAAEYEIANLRQRIDAVERMSIELTETLKYKMEEGDAYIAEIETIGQAYEDMQAQNQRLLQQITERDDYNTQLVSESVKAKQLQASLLAEKQLLASRMQHVNAASDLQKQRVVRLEEQARLQLDQLSKAADETRHYTTSLDSFKRKASELEKESIAAKSLVDAVQKELQEQGQRRAELELQLETERFEKRRIQESYETLSSRVMPVTSHSDGGTAVERLQEEIKEYKAILKCSVCHDRRKEVVITKCYHLFCAQCIQRTLEIRHRKCPGCGVPFGQNDVRTVYI